METIHTVRVNLKWLDEAVAAEGSATNLAKRLGVSPSTITRQYREQAEASPRLIGAVLVNYPVTFQDAFDVTEEQVRVRRARMVKTTAA
ncbi:hypothetical protein [Corynebacterium bouchesdurhonense]|uniref:hypothetical protein n=1 Tax=Corynebacterium bouchesdurhonense TaxID=1720192 RepID=UPI000836308F|nr:hypothetical protein [Corynebacterium bouchesdurhonense]